MARLGRSFPKKPLINKALTGAGGHTTKTHLVDAWIVGTKKTYSVDALLKKIQSDTYSVDATLLKTQTKTYSVDADLKKTQTNSHLVDAILLRTTTKTYQVDADLLKTTTKTYNVDAWLVGTKKTYQVDADLLKTTTKTYSVDASLRDGPYVSGLTTATGAASITINVPSGTASGEKLLAVILLRASQTISSVPSGWSLLRTDVTTDTTASGARQYIYQRTAGAS